MRREHRDKSLTDQRSPQARTPTTRPQKKSNVHGKRKAVQHSATIATVATQGANPTASGHRKGSSSRPAKRDVLWLWWPTSRLKLSIGMSYEFFLPACPRIGSSSSSKFPWWTFENWFGTIFTWNHNFACKCPVFTLCHGPYKLHEEVALSSFRTPRESLWIRIGSLGKRLGNEIHCSSKSVGNSLRLASFYNSEFIASSNAAGVDSSNASPSSQTASYT